MTSQTSSLSTKFSSVQDGIYAFGKAHMRSDPSPEVSPTLSLKRFQCSSDLGWEAHGTHCCQKTRQGPQGQEDTPCKSGRVQTRKMHLQKCSCICIQYNTIQLYCLYVEKFAFWLVIYIKTFNAVNNKTSTTQ